MDSGSEVKSGFELAKPCMKFNGTFSDTNRIRLFRFLLRILRSSLVDSQTIANAMSEHTAVARQLLLEAKPPDLHSLDLPIDASQQVRDNTVNFGIVSYL